MLSEGLKHITPDGVGRNPALLLQTFHFVEVQLQGYSVLAIKAMRQPAEVQKLSSDQAE